MLGLLGFYDEFQGFAGQSNGSIRDAMQPVGEADEAEIVAYLDAGHFLIDVMEAGNDVISGSLHRHSVGCSSLLSDGSWVWRKDFPHYLETYHVALPGEFVEDVRKANYRMPSLLVAEFAPKCDETLPVIGWSTAVPWQSESAVIQPFSRAVMTKAEFEAAQLAREQDRPTGKWSKRRKPRRV
ncbi:hypothetical protein GCM10023329_50400 [Streptomyces sanyensis]|uniref:Uncharacterized protein n=1 Tax=Streptomyces sanyensis TaxID=568869 RepID=A0ABP9B9K4_9ACTN